MSKITETRQGLGSSSLLDRTTPNPAPRADFDPADAARTPSTPSSLPNAGRCDRLPRGARCADYWNHHCQRCEARREAERGAGATDSVTGATAAPAARRPDGAYLVHQPTYAIELVGIDRCGCEESLALRDLLGERPAADPRQLPLVAGEGAEGDGGGAVRHDGHQAPVVNHEPAAGVQEEAVAAGATRGNGGVVVGLARGQRGRRLCIGAGGEVITAAGGEDGQQQEGSGAHGQQVEGAPGVPDMAVSVQAWGWACAHCGTAFKAELGDPCPDCGHFGKRTVWETDVVAECHVCGGAYFGCSECPRCARARKEKLARAFMYRCDVEWEKFFETLPGFEGWPDALVRAKIIAQEQRIAALALDAQRAV